MNPYHILGLLLCLLPQGATAQVSLFDSLYRQGDTLDLYLDTEYRRLVRRRLNKEYQPATVRLPGFAEALPVKVRTRGHMRLQQCTQPSLQLKFKKKHLRAMGLDTLNKLKLVLQCDRGNRGLGYLRREMLAYDIHGLVSTYTHRHLPVRLHAGGEVTHGMLLEPEGDLAKRYAARIVKTEKLSCNALDREHYVRLCLFNYLILNTDWYIYNTHNVEVLYTADGRVISIPYDFDYSGFVGTHYAVPHESRDQLSVHDPLFCGQDVTVEELAAEVDYFLPLRPRITALIADHPTLEERQRKRLLRRVEAFYETVGNPKRLQRILSK